MEFNGERRQYPDYPNRHSKETEAYSFDLYQEVARIDTAVKNAAHSAPAQKPENIRKLECLLTERMPGELESVVAEMQARDTWWNHFWQGYVAASGVEKDNGIISGIDFKSGKNTIHAVVERSADKVASCKLEKSV